MLMLMLMLDYLEVHVQRSPATYSTLLDAPAPIREARAAALLVTVQGGYRGGWERRNSVLAALLSGWLSGLYGLPRLFAGHIQSPATTPSGVAVRPLSGLL